MRIGVLNRSGSRTAAIKRRRYCAQTEGVYAAITLRRTASARSTAATEWWAAARLYRACLTGILFVLRSGIPWQMLPKEPELRIWRDVPGAHGSYETEGAERASDPPGASLH